MKANEPSILDEGKVYEILKDTFPSQNDYAKSDYKEELDELIHFGIKTEHDLKSLLQKHHKEIMEIDATPVDKKSEVV